MSIFIFILSSILLFISHKGRPEGAESDIAAKFKVDMTTCPSFLFWPAGSRLSKPLVPPESITTNAEFQTWMWGYLQVEAHFVNRHTHEVAVHWMRDKKSEDQFVLKAGETQKRLVSTHICISYLIPTWVDTISDTLYISLSFQGVFKSLVRGAGLASVLQQSHQGQHLALAPHTRRSACRRAVRSDNRVQGDRHQQRVSELGQPWGVQEEP